MLFFYCKNHNNNCNKVNANHAGFVKSHLAACGANDSKGKSLNNPYLFLIRFISRDNKTTITAITGNTDNGSNITLLKKVVVSDEYFIPTNDYVH